MRLFSKGVLATALALVTAAGVQAVPFSELRLDNTGRGTWHLTGERRESVSNCTLVLKYGGDCEVYFSGGVKLTLKGRWRSAGLNSVDLDITRYFGNSARGDGDIRLGRNRGDYFIESLNISGDTVGKRFRVDFRGNSYGSSSSSGGDSSWGSSDLIDIEPDYVGRGILKTAQRPRERLTRLTVKMKNDGTGDIWVTGDSTYKISGNWHRVRGRDIEMTVTSGFGDYSTDGTARIRLRSARRGERVESVNISGFYRGSRYHLDFTVGRID